MAPRQTWTDDRLDDFRAETKREFTAVRTEMRAGFAQVEKRLEGVDKRFDKVDERFDKIDERFDKIDARFERIDERFERIDARFEGINQEFVAVRREMKDGFDKLNRTLLWFCGSLLATVVASLLTLVVSLVIP